MLTEDNYRDLEEKGYTVVKDVISQDDCDKTIGQYQEWLSQFKDGDWPFSEHSIIRRYNAGHMAPTWFIRLKAKAVFAQVWKTDKLLSSIDAIAIGRPPEDGQEEFHMPGKHWLHLDQSSARLGLHAYQGAVYLEEACEDDWTLQVVEGSHKYFEEFFENNPQARILTPGKVQYLMKEEDLAYMYTRGCAVKRVPVPKCGMVLWDSRLVHANADPIKGRQNPGRWRYCVFVSMAPAIWASEHDMERKKRAYDNTMMTGHSSAQGIQLFPQEIPAGFRADVDFPKTVPEIGRTTEAKQLAGAMPYDFKDGKPTAAERMPVWRGGIQLDEI